MIVGEPGETRAVEVHGKGVVAGAEDVDSHVELSSSQEQRVQDVPLADVVFSVDLLVGTLPPADVADLVEDEDALALTFGGLDDETSTGFIIHRILSLCWCLLNSS